jgi:hypothetical protein
MCIMPFLTHLRLTWQNKSLASQGIKIPYITTLHGTDITLVGKDASFEPVITFAINESDAVTSVSESLKQDTYKYLQCKTRH